MKLGGKSSGQKQKMWFEINCKGTSVRIVCVFLLLFFCFFHASSSLVNVCVTVEQISNCVKKELQNLSLLTISPLQCVYVRPMVFYFLDITINYIGNCGYS